MDTAIQSGHQFMGRRAHGLLKRLFDSWLPGLLYCMDLMHNVECFLYLFTFFTAAVGWRTNAPAARAICCQIWFLHGSQGAGLWHVRFGNVLVWMVVFATGITRGWCGGLCWWFWGLLHHAA